MTKIANSETKIIFFVHGGISIKKLWCSMYIRWFRIFQTSCYQGIVKATVSVVFEDLKFETSEGSDQWLSQFSWDSQQGRLRTTSILVQAFWNSKPKVLKYPPNCSLHNTLILWSLKNPVSPNIHEAGFFLVRAFRHFKLKVLNYSRNCSLHNTLIPWSLKNPESPNIHIYYRAWVRNLKLRISLCN